MSPAETATFFRPPFLNKNNLLPSVIKPQGTGGGANTLSRSAEITRQIFCSSYPSPMNTSEPVSFRTVNGIATIDAEKITIESQKLRLGSPSVWLANPPLHQLMAIQSLFYAICMLVAYGWVEKITGSLWVTRLVQASLVLTSIPVLFAFRCTLIPIVPREGIIWIKQKPPKSDYDYGIVKIKFKSGRKLRCYIKSPRGVAPYEEMIEAMQKCELIDTVGHTSPK